MPLRQRKSGGGPPHSNVGADICNRVAELTRKVGHYNCKNGNCQSEKRNETREGDRICGTLELLPPTD